jgi:hypothetical protein
MSKANIYKPVMVCSEEHYMKYFEDAHKRNWDELKRVEANVIAEGGILHRFLYEAVADGQAVYQVIKLNKKTAKVRWCQIDPCYADYVVPQWGMEATVSLEYIENAIRWQDAMREAFAKRTR